MVTANTRTTLIQWQKCFRALRKWALYILIPLITIQCLALILRTELSDEPHSYPQELLDYLDDARQLRGLPEELPRFHIPVDYADSESSDWFPRGQSPIFQAMVEDGLLPEVHLRTGPEPMVLEGPDGIGNYGGTWFRIATNPSTIRSVLEWRLGGFSLVRWSPKGEPVVPHIARDWSANEDATEWTFYLREGIRWSDGHPFTADDILYWWQDEVMNQRIRGLAATPPDFMVINGLEGRIEKVDRYTVRFVFPLPNPLFVERLAGTYVRPFSPRHFLKPYHPDYGDPDFMEDARRARGYGNIEQHYQFLQAPSSLIPEMPTMSPWVYRSYSSSGPFTFIRNPYYWAVDSQGNQLPYIDRVFVEIKSRELIPIAASNGEITFQFRYLSHEDYPQLMTHRDRGDYEVLHWVPGYGSEWTIWPNLNRRIEPDDPSTKKRHELLNTRDFRRALSISLNRQEIINNYYGGVGQPAQLAPPRYSQFFRPSLQTRHTEFNPDEARKILDQLGLDQRDAEGFRTFPDGSMMTWFINYMDFTGAGPVELIAEYWRDVGLRVIPRERARNLYAIESSSDQHDFSVMGGASEFNPLLEPRSFVPVHSASLFAPRYGRWYAGGGMHGNPDALRAGRPPPEDHPLRESMEVLNRASLTLDQGERIQIFERALEIAEEEILSFSIATAPPMPVVTDRNLRNVPATALVDFRLASPSNTAPELYYFEQPIHGRGIAEQIREDTLSPKRSPRVEQIASAADGSTSKWRPFLHFLWIGGLIGGTLVTAIRFPFIGRRLLIMLPTLGVISFACFAIIQMPPGNYVETQILMLQMQGAPTSEDEVAHLRELYHLDEPFLQQYARWVGLYWFTSFSAEDTGLLQGDLGRSMEHGVSVNQLVGDRILLTLLISIGTILFTWIVALPIGIYSALRPYSLGDYVATLIGFIGMCIPNFLLALLVIYWSNHFLGIQVTGLFSSEYAAQPFWNLAKVWDFLKHVWVPVLVLGITGTAGMIRVMRGNLMDELRKPYVTTARAKGVRPMKLVLKYPVRIALNPFISGIGMIFPHIISGGAIVSIVLSLPTVGPMMLTALMTEDIYFAGSLLMILGFLGVIGTLVSDLLLMWLDPRIRMEGKS
ncbi:MAG: ABC transporter permease subunit [Opitutales bacterium]|nr:ABC transporter permease subunit [Opitutales bacterium]